MEELKKSFGCIHYIMLDEYKMNWSSIEKESMVKQDV